MGLAFGDLELDLGAFELRRAGGRVPIEPQAFDVLVYLAEHRDRVVSKEELMDRVWGGRFVSESAVTSRIKQVRRAVGDDGQRQSVISTVHGRGYRFVAPTQEQPGPASERVGIPMRPASPSGLARQVTGIPDAHERLPRIGRARERAALRQCLDAAREGRGRLVLISGEPGIGKTELLADVLEYAGSVGACVLAGRAVASGGTYRPFAEALAGPWRSGLVTESAALAPFRAALGRILPGWTAPQPPVSDVDPVVLLGEGIAQVLLGLQAPVRLLALEDLHHADPDTLAVLDYLAAAVAALPVLIVGTHRDWPRPPDLDRLTISAYVERMTLSRLAPDETGQLVDAIAQLSEPARELVVQRSEGLPVVVADLVDTVASQSSWTSHPVVPRDFAALIDARMAALATDERRLLAAAAVLGPTPPWELAAQAAEVDRANAVSALQHAVQVHLLAVQDGQLAWRHGLVPHAVWATVLPPERRALTRAAAALLLTQDAEESMTAAAELLTMIGDTDQATEVWLALAANALARGALRTAEELLHRGAATGRRSAMVALRRVEFLTVVGRAAEALEVGAAALEQARGDEHAQLCLGLGRAAVATGRWSLADHYVALAGRPDEPAALLLLADSAHGAGNVEAAAAHAQQAVARARAAGLADVQCDALCCQARILRLSEPPGARAAFQQAVQVASEHGMPARRLDALFGLGTIELLEQQDSGTLMQAREAALELGMLGTVAQADVLLADHALVHDGPGALPEFAARLREHASLLDAPALGDTAEILMAARDALVGADPGAQGHIRLVHRDRWHDEQAELLVVPALAALVGHDYRAALTSLDVAMPPLLAHRSAAPLCYFGLWALLATIQRGPGDLVRVEVSTHPAALRRLNAGALRFCDAVVSGRAGDRAGAATAYRRGEQLLAPAPWWQRFVRLPVLEAAAADGWGNPVPQLRADLAAHEAAGDVALARICRGLLRQAGAAVPRTRGETAVPPALRALGVTSRELEVLRLVVAGLSNQAISERLLLSPRTVETHVANLLTKTGSAGRGELRAWS